MDISFFVSEKRCLRFPGKSRHDMQIEKNVSNRLHGSHTRTMTNFQAFNVLFITKCDTRSRHTDRGISTKSSKRSKLKEIFIHIGYLEVQIMVENPFPDFSTTINLSRMIRLTSKKHDYLSFPFLFESKHSCQ